MHRQVPDSCISLLFAGNTTSALSLWHQRALKISPKNIDSLSFRELQLCLSIQKVSPFYPERHSHERFSPVLGGPGDKATLNL